MKSTFFKSLKKTFTSKKFLTVAAIFALCVVPTFAAGGSDSIVELDNWADKILELFQSSWVKAILLVALIVEAIGMVLAVFGMVPMEKLDFENPKSLCYKDLENIGIQKLTAQAEKVTEFKYEFK